MRLKVFKNHLDRMEENICRCGRTPSEIGEEFILSEDEGRTELSYASVREDEYVAPPVENSIPLPVPALAPCCLGPTTTLPALEEITEEPADLPPFARTSDPSPTHSASPLLLCSSHLYDQATASVPD